MTALETRWYDTMYQPIAEQETDMSTVAERVGASSVTLPSHDLHIHGYDFLSDEIRDDKEREFVFRSLFPVGLEAFVQNPSEAMEKDIREHIFAPGQHLLVMRSDGTLSFGLDDEGLPRMGKPRPIAFRMWRTYETSVGKALYLAGMCVLPQWQGMGIGQSMTRYAIEKEDPSVVFTVTQNPVVKESMDKAVGVESYPSLWRANGTEVGKLVEELAREIGKKVDAQTSIIKGNYGASLYGRQPQSRTPKYQQLFDRLDLKAGDAYLLCAIR